MMLSTALSETCAAAEAANDASAAAADPRTATPVKPFTRCAFIENLLSSGPRHWRQAPSCARGFLARPARNRGAMPSPGRIAVTLDIHFAARGDVLHHRLVALLLSLDVGIGRRHRVEGLLEGRLQQSAR